MSFKKQKVFFLLPFLFLSHCGLKMGETSLPVPKYKFSLGSDYCSEYREKFISYFFKEQEENAVDNLSGRGVSRALECIVSRIKRAQALIDHEHFEKQQLLNFLNQDFIKTKDVEKIIDHFTGEEHFGDYILIKDSIIHLIGKKPKDPSIYRGALCQRQKTGKTVFSKKEADVIVNFLEGLSDLLLKAESDSYEVFEHFSKKKGFLSKSQLKESDDFKRHFVSFLSDYLVESFPSYSFFLKSLLPEDYDPEKDLVTYGTTMEINKTLQPLLDISQLPWPSSDELNVQNIKYIMLNIYIVQAFFSVYDLNQDSTLNSEELELLSCLITPLISVIVSKKLKDSWEGFKWFTKPQALTNYIIQYQRMPTYRLSSDLEIPTVHFTIYRVFKYPESWRDLSYTDVSRLISTLFSELFYTAKPHL